MSASLSIKAMRFIEKAVITTHIEVRYITLPAPT